MAEEDDHRVQGADQMLHKNMSRQDMIITCEQLMMDNRVYFGAYATLFTKFRLMSDGDFAATDADGRTLIFIATLHGETTIE